MHSLAELYIHGKGVRERRTTGNDWLWQAVLLQSAGAFALLDAKALLPIEMHGMVGVVGQVRGALKPGQAFKHSGPNLTSLLACLMQKLRQNRFLLRPFAAAKPTLTVGNETHEGATGAVPMIGTELLEEPLCFGGAVKPRRSYRNFSVREARSLQGSFGTNVRRRARADTRFCIKYLLSHSATTSTVVAKSIRFAPLKEN